MKTIAEILLQKHSDVQLFRDDLICERDSVGWKDRHPIGPVHVDCVCKLCGDVVAGDLMGYGWLHNDSFWKHNIAPHFLEKHKPTTHPTREEGVK